MTIEGGSEHYKGGKVEPLELIESQGLPFHLANVVKYAVRAHFYAGKNHMLTLEAIDKAIWYLNRYKEIYWNGKTISISETQQQNKDKDS